MNLVREVTRLERARNNAGLTRAELAREAGVQAKTIWLLEEQRSVPRLTTRRCIAAALKIPHQSLWPSGVDEAAISERRAA